MQLLRLAQVPDAGEDRVYRHPRLSTALLWLSGAVMAASLLAHAVVAKWPPGYVFGLPLLLLMLLTRRMVIARFHPSNWLVRMNATDIYIQYRSYLNYGMSASAPSVVMVSLGEIASARLVKERVETPDPGKVGATQVQSLRYVDLELSGDTTELAKALQTERDEPAPVEKHWYGSSATLYRDYPVTMKGPKIVRIHWNVVPSAHAFLNALRPYTAIVDPVSLRRDFSHLKSLSPEDQRTQLRELAARGDTVTAVDAARQIYGCSLGQAKQIVDSLSC